MSDDMNSAEAEAEAILKDAIVRLNGNGEDCPLGEACAMHHRNDERLFNEGAEWGRLITYVGDYAVITGDNPEASPEWLLVQLAKAILGDDPGDVPPLYETCVYRVGSEGALADLRAFGSDELSEALRLVRKHDDWSEFENVHNKIVADLTAQKED